MNSFSQTIRKLREEKKLPLRTVAAHLDIDQAILSKIERGQRKANRELVLKLAGFFKVDESDLLVSWLSDKLVYEVADEEVALKALQAAEEKLEYLSFKKMGRNEILKKLNQELKKFNTIRKAWIFGSFARNEDNPKSDIDMTLETDSGFTYFDLAQVKHTLENSLHKKIDIGFADSLKPEILEDIKPDLQLIYER